MKVVMLVYHKNVFNVYKKHWIDNFVHSVLNQTYKDFTVYEMNYGGGEERLFEDSVFESKELPTFVHAMNYLIEKALDDGADAIANSNCDDTMSLDRLEIQLPFIENGYDVVSSNFCLVRDDSIIKFHRFDKLDLKHELSINHNIIAHPSCIYSRHYLLNNKYEPDLIPLEDLILWQRTVDNYRFKIVPENLLFHRLHDNSVCQNPENR